MPFSETDFNFQLLSLESERRQSHHLRLIATILSNTVQANPVECADQVIPRIIRSKLTVSCKVDLIFKTIAKMSEFSLARHLVSRINSTEDAYYFFTRELLASKCDSQTLEWHRKISLQWFAQDASGQTADELLMNRFGNGKITPVNNVTQQALSDLSKAAAFYCVDRDSLPAHLKCLPHYQESNAAAVNTGAGVGAGAGSVSTQAMIENGLNPGVGRKAGALGLAEVQLRADAPEYKLWKPVGSGLLSGKRPLSGSVIWTPEQAKRSLYQEASSLEESFFSGSNVDEVVEEALSIVATGRNRMAYALFKASEEAQVETQTVLGKANSA
jgi:hypothetical protein